MKLKRQFSITAKDVIAQFPVSVPFQLLMACGSEKVTKLSHHMMFNQSVCGLS